MRLVHAHPFGKIKVHRLIEVCVCVCVRVLSEFRHFFNSEISKFRLQIFAKKF